MSCVHVSEELSLSLTHPPALFLLFLTKRKMRKKEKRGNVEKKDGRWVDVLLCSLIIQKMASVINVSRIICLCKCANS